MGKKLEPTRIEDVPVRELSGLALTRAEGRQELLAVGDRKSVLARAVLTDQPLEWTAFELERGKGGPKLEQFEAITTSADGSILVLCESPPVVLVLHPGGELDTVELSADGKGDLGDVLSASKSAGEGLLPLDGGHLLMAKEKDPPMLVEFGPRGDEPAGVRGTSVARPGGAPERWSATLHALAAWGIDDVDDLSDLSFRDGALYCLSDQSRRVVRIDLPLDPGSTKARARETWDLRVPERDGEPNGKPEGLVVTDDGELIVGLDTRTAHANLCWYQP